jgi:hypothetical protein
MFTDIFVGGLSSPTYMTTAIAMFRDRVGPDCFDHKIESGFVELMRNQ